MHYACLARCSNYNIQSTQMGIFAIFFFFFCLFTFYAEYPTLKHTTIMSIMSISNSIVICHNILNFTYFFLYSLNKQKQKLQFPDLWWLCCHNGTSASSSLQCCSEKVPCSPHCMLQTLPSYSSYSGCENPHLVSAGPWMGPVAGPGWLAAVHVVA